MENILWKLFCDQLDREPNFLAHRVRALLLIKHCLNLNKKVARTSRSRSGCKSVDFTQPIASFAMRPQKNYTFGSGLRWRPFSAHTRISCLVWWDGELRGLVYTLGFYVCINILLTSFYLPLFTPPKIHPRLISKCALYLLLQNDERDILGPTKKTFARLRAHRERGASDTSRLTCPLNYLFASESPFFGVPTCATRINLL